jgi:hypothetical protein
MANHTSTIRKFIGNLNNPEELGGFWLPNIQRPFVWKEEQTERLFDSILREYPIGSLLIWKTRSEIKHRKFIDNWHEGLKLKDFYVPENDNQKMLVLDGQQRLQSLFIGLKGSHSRKELYINILSGDLKAPEDMKYEFRFMDGNAKFPFVKFKELVYTEKRNSEIKKTILTFSYTSVSDEQEVRIEENIEIIRNVFCTQENIIYQVVDSIDRPDLYKDDDIVEIFIRANSGGTPLNKSDLMFSLLVSSWEDAEENMTDLLDDLNKTGYKFNRDFILKTFLVLLDKGARFNVDKLRDESTRAIILDRWKELAESVRKVKDFIYGSTFLKTDKTIPSYLSLIPMIYFRYHMPFKWESNKKELGEYLVRTSLSGVFGGTPDNLIDKIIKRINADFDFVLNEIVGIIREDGRNLEISKEIILNLNYWKKEIHLLFNIWYGFNYQPSSLDNKPQIDHVFPQSALKKIKIENPDTGKMNMMKYHWEDRDQIGNLMLLTAAENGAGGKTDIMPEEWFADKGIDYLDLHLIPKDRELWKIENFEKFIEARKQLILNKFDYLLLK